MTFPELADFFFTSQPSVVKLECFEISHPSFSQTHRICRNSGADLRVSHADALPPIWEWDGIDDRVSMPDALSYERTDAFTFSAFIRADSITQWGAGFPSILNRTRTSDSRQIAWAINPTNGRVRTHIGGLTGTNELVIDSSGGITVGQYTHIAMVYTGGGNPAALTHYINAVAQADVVITNNLTSNVSGVGTLTIGNHPTIARAWRGIIEHLTVWDGAKTAGEIAQLYNSGVPPDVTTLGITGLRLWLKFDENDRTGSNGIIDYGPDGLHGTALNGLGDTPSTESSITYSYYPMQVKHIGTTNSLDQKMEITFGDMGEVLPQELSRIAARNTFHTRPELTYREYRSDLIQQVTSETEWIFDGVNDIVSIGNVLAFERTQSFSVMGWANLSNPAISTIIGKVDVSTTRGYVLFYLATGQIRFRIRNNSAGPNSLEVQTVASFNDGLEHHVAATYAGTSTPAGIVIYVDGVSVPFTTVSNTLTATIVGTASLVIGASQNGTTSFQSGLLRHISVWNDDLSAANVLAAYGGGSPPDLLTNPAAASLVGWWKLDVNDTVGANGIEDHSSNNNHGTAGGGLQPTETDSEIYNVAPIYGPVTLEMDELRFTKTGCSFTAKAKAFNKARIGEVYDVGRFPMLRAFL